MCNVLLNCPDDVPPLSSPIACVYNPYIDGNPFTNVIDWSTVIASLVMSG